MRNTKKRTRIEDIRRVELIQAAHRVFRAEGLTGLTTARICAEAGMSPGILAYYFKGKKDALYEMVRYNNRILLEDIVARLRAATTPWDRIVAIVDGNFPMQAYERATAMPGCRSAQRRPQTLNTPACKGSSTAACARTSAIPSARCLPAPGCATWCCRSG